MKMNRGEKYGRLLAVRYVGHRKPYKHAKYPQATWLFRCDCGKKTIKNIYQVRSGSVRSCGCLFNEILSKNWAKSTTHGRYMGIPMTKLGKIYRGIIQRCYDKKHPHYANYGGRGIGCEWTSFKSFRDDTHEEYRDHVKRFGEKNTSIDRIDNNGNYSKSNCRWATLKEQARNKRRTRFIGGLPLTEYCENNKCSPSKLWQRIRLGWEEGEIVNNYHRPKLGERSYNERNLRELKKHIMEQFRRSANIVKAYLSALDEREKEILEKRLGIIDGKRHTLEEIGKEYGLTRERIRQIEYRGLKKMVGIEKELVEDLHLTEH